MPDAAAEFRADEAELVAQRPEQRHVRLDVERRSSPVEDECGHGAAPPFVSAVQLT